VIYASGATKGIVGAFEVSGLTVAKPSSLWKRYNKGTGLTKLEFDDYFGGVSTGYAICIGKTWKIHDPISLKRLRELSVGFRPPQSYHYWNLNELLRISGQRFLSQESRRGSGDVLRSVADGDKRKSVRSK
jgi:predicted transcriptional regulator